MTHVILIHDEINLKNATSVHAFNRWRRKRRYCFDSNNMDSLAPEPLHTPHAEKNVRLVRRNGGKTIRDLGNGLCLLR
jgi:hypothetical protein